MVSPKLIMPPKTRTALATFLLALILLILFSIFLLTRRPLPTKYPHDQSTPTQTFVENTPEQTKNSTQQLSAFSFTQGILTINTKLLEIKIEGGAITYVADKSTGEVLVDSAAYINWPSDTAGFTGYVVETSDGATVSRWPTESSVVTFTMKDPNHGLLTYGPLETQGTEGANQLTIDIVLDPLTGEVVLQLTGIETNNDVNLISIDIPIVNATTSSVILGSGASYSRTDANASDQTTYIKYGLYSPTMAIIQGADSVLAAWSESIEYSPEYIRLNHKRAYDQVILHAGQVDGLTESETITSPPWRIGTYATWLDAARRWREEFEERTGAKPLWENPVAWVRNVHSTFDATNEDYGSDPQKYAELASKTPPEKTLFLLWNGDRIVLFGDPTLVTEIARPTPESLRILKTYGWPLLLYHPYNLINSKTGMTNRLNSLANKGWLPENYQFNPVYDGSPDEWFDYWSNVKVNYHDGSKDYLIHPGATKFTNYMIHNYGDYIIRYQADGAYFDTLGIDHDFLFPDNMKIIDGYNFVMGEVNTISKVENSLPNFAIMSEYQSPWILPLVFYSWEGSATHIPQNILAGTRINHPLRVALLGSYSWSRESNEDNPDDIVSALMGSLPQVSLVGDYHVSDKRAIWSQARAKLFCDEELFNDLPEKWESDVLAYYRSNRTGHWFKFQYIGSTYGYIEILDDGTEVVRLVK